MKITVVSTQLLRVKARVLQFIQNLKRKKNGKELVTDISFENIEFAELLWHKEAQSSFDNDKTIRKTKETLSGRSGHYSMQGPN